MFVAYFGRMNNDVSNFLNGLQHPLHESIFLLRELILSQDSGLEENLKWNAPNYVIDGQDRITLKILPPNPRKIQVVFHCGAKKVKPAESPLIQDEFAMLEWKGNDRAIFTFTGEQDIQLKANTFKELVRRWLTAKNH